ncbi:MAG: D-alanyl-D-alanine carboxypeptidase family protein [Patescibacteria group bacterium]|nr:D-alanyl-D-alanine carboxypeptidase family protein [Patescibacteria group bacterium]MDE1988122.1 D-alanyl-D-alanine carboxypeptidase family protein [Patescibacteria group bacterium]MDE2218220.1 D-alanyl-D-alanine carboxypeptidase family protein [Patescibacteria group bacterium]
MKNFSKKIFQKVGLISFAYRLSYKLGIISMIPTLYIRSIPIRDNGESLVPILSSEKIIVFCPDEEVVLVRKTVLDKIVFASSNLPDGFKLKVLYGYRSLRVQRKFWEEVCSSIRQKNSKLTKQEVEAEAHKYSAIPNGKGPHQTGGAVDVLIVNGNEVSLDFGTEYRGYGNKVPMYSKSITHEQKQNRKMLKNIMRSAGFVNYPGEWWHYSFGDQIWAAYTDNKHALYDFL